MRSSNLANQLYGDEPWIRIRSESRSDVASPSCHALSSSILLVLLGVKQTGENLVARLQSHGICRIVGDTVGSDHMLATRVRIAGLGGSDLVRTQIETVSQP